LAEQSLDPEHASQDIGLLCWEISRSTIVTSVDQGGGKRRSVIKVSRQKMDE